MNTPTTILAVLLIAVLLTIWFIRRQGKKRFRFAVCERAEELMRNFLENPEQDRFDAAYRFLHVNSIKASEVDKELLGQFIKYIQANQVAQ